MLCTRGAPCVDTATVIDDGADAIDLGNVEYCTVTGVCGRLMFSCFDNCWWMIVLGWAACAGAGVIVVPSR